MRRTLTVPLVLIGLDSSNQQLPVFLSIMCYNGDIMKLKENIMNFLDKEQLIVVIICGILIIIGISI